MHTDYCWYFFNDFNLLPAWPTNIDCFHPNLLAFFLSRSAVFFSILDIFRLFVCLRAQTIYSTHTLTNDTKALYTFFPSTLSLPQFSSSGSSYSGQCIIIIIIIMIIVIFHSSTLCMSYLRVCAWHMMIGNRNQNLPPTHPTFEIFQDEKQRCKQLWNH